MRKVLLFITLCLSNIVGWAIQVETIHKWNTEGYGYPQENVITLKLENAGELNTYLANADLSGYGVLSIKSDQQLTLSSADLSALSQVTCATIDMQDLKTSATFTFTNATVKRVILPDFWDKVAVKAAAEAIVAGNSGFEAALSQHGQKNQGTADAGLVAYVNKPGTLHLAMLHTFYTGPGETKKMGNATNKANFDKLGYVSIMGYPSARDFTREGNYNDDGHFVPNVEANETDVNSLSGKNNTRRASTGTRLEGALKGIESLISLDLEDAVVYDQWNADLTFHQEWGGALGQRTKQVILPKCAELKTIPADCLSDPNISKLEEVCIPGNIEVIKTRAFYSTVHILRHIWTTSTKTLAPGEEDHTVYDNGTYLVSNPNQIDHTGHAPLNSTVWNNGLGFDQNPRYGTITLPANLKLIESNAFYCDCVSDVYVLAVKAPECHVNAFSSMMYLGNNTIDDSAVRGGMVTRESYAQNAAQGKLFAFLHFPRESQSPDVERYTDPTRDFSVATTMRDGNGNIIFFPNRSEMTRAYYQGQTGYLWQAWDLTRGPEGGGNPNAFKTMYEGDFQSHSDASQTWANNAYSSNTFTGKTDRSFYDVRLGNGEQVKFSQPNGLQWYYNATLNGSPLYPERTAEVANDYRGWHQFVLTANSTMTNIPIVPISFKQNDNDWWTICLPFDLKYNDLIKFFGDEKTGKMPYLSKLQYVVRDYDLERITMMFSNNLMIYKEDVQGNNVHGDINNTTKYSPQELQANPVILHKGVPYLIRPNLKEGAPRQWDICQTTDPDLYARIFDSRNVNAGTLESYIYKGEYTVPAYVVGNNSEEATTNSRTFEMYGDYSKTYSSGLIDYRGGKKQASVSSSFHYTFVGSFFNSVLPQYCYFLGWDNENNCAAFWYNSVTDLTSQNWNVQTGIICPNFDKSTLIHKATSLSDPARWKITAVADDKLIGVSSSANNYTMDFGGIAPSESTGIEEVTATTMVNVNDGIVYNINGQVVRTDGSLQDLSKGVYIVNGKKYVVK